MFTFLVIIIILVCILLAFAILIQNPKGSGLGAGFANIGNQVMGARRATETIEKATWILAVSLLSLTLLSAVFLPKHTGVIVEQERSQTEGLLQNRPVAPPAGFNPPPTGGGMEPAPSNEVAPPSGE